MKRAHANSDKFECKHCLKTAPRGQSKFCRAVLVAHGITSAGGNILTSAGGNITSAGGNMTMAGGKVTRASVYTTRRE